MAEEYIVLIDSIQISKWRLLFFSKYGCCEMLNEFGSWREVLALLGVKKGAEEG